jgi:antagonist of KipI
VNNSSEILTITFLKTGMLTVLQDEGRPGYQYLGIPYGGYLDEPSATIANELVGNPPNRPVLEITLLGPKIEFDRPVQVAISGGNLSPMINNKPVPMYETIDIYQGDVLSFGRVVRGCRSYVAIGGDWIIDACMGSASPLIINERCWNPDSQIGRNSKLKIEIKKPIVPLKWAMKEVPISSAIRLTKGPEYYQFSKEYIAEFLKQTFMISPNSNRMGLRLDPPIPFDLKSGKMISSGIVPGTVQITPTGQPIVLLNDAQTIGGYPRIANVLKKDMSMLAQAKPGDSINFSFDY